MTVDGVLLKGLDLKKEFYSFCCKIMIFDKFKMLGNITEMDLMLVIILSTSLKELLTMMYSWVTSKIFSLWAWVPNLIIESLVIFCCVFLHLQNNRLLAMYFNTEYIF